MPAARGGNAGCDFRGAFGGRRQDQVGGGARSLRLYDRDFCPQLIDALQEHVRREEKAELSTPSSASALRITSNATQRRPSTPKALTDSRIFPGGLLTVDH